MKKFLAIFAAALLAVCVLTGCSGNQKAEYVILKDALADEEYAIGFRKADFALRDAVQQALVDLKKDGTVAEISQKWFNEDLSDIPDSFTPSNSKDDSLQKVKESGKLRMGLDDSFPPMGYDDDGEIVGFDIDLAGEVCKKLGVELELVPIVWAQNVQELNDNNIDCIWNGMSVSDDREAAMNLSEPYMKNRQVIVTLKGSGIESLADLADKSVILQRGSTASLALDDDPELKASLRGGAATEVENNVLAMYELQKGNGDAVLMDEVVAQYYVSHLTDLEEAAQ